MNSFDHFFQKKAKEYDIPFEEADWLKLEKKLDLQAARIAYRKKMIWIAAAAILIISLLGYFTYENHNRLNQIIQQLDSDVTQPADQPSLTNPILTLNDLQPEEQPGENTEEQMDDAEEVSNNSISQITDRNGDPVSVNEDITDKPVTTQQGTDDNSDQHLEVDITVANVAPSLVPQVESLTPITTITAPGAAKAEPQKSSLPQLTTADVITENASPDRVSLGFVAGPDLTSVESVTSFHDPGYKIGLMLEYNISSRLSVSAGAIQSLVRYSTKSQSYNPPVYWSGGIAPNEMVGECLLVDIPVNLKYNFLNFERSRFFATTGLSSYIMMNEDYYFSYDGDDSELMQSWSGKTGSRHWLSNASFSIGYEIDIHSNWSLRAEPFIKAPLKEVGWSNVKLFSAGSFFSLNYRL